MNSDNHQDEIPSLKNKVIDIWPINFYTQSETISDQSWKFMVQLACILQMVPGWKNKTKLRLFSTNQMPNIDALQRTWARRLKQLRIECQLETSYWPEMVSAEVDCYRAAEVDEVREQVVEHFDRVNEHLREHSAQSTLVFVYLPPPPLHKAVNEDYLRHMTHMTEGLPPTMLVHGLTEVTSDAY